MGSARFYGSNLGNRLIDPLRFPREIKFFLAEEARLLGSIASSFDLLVEVGCMHGRYLDWALTHKKMYLGVDIVKEYVEEGCETVRRLGLDRNKYGFVWGGAENIGTLVEPTVFGPEPSRTLLFFPFNSIGNVVRLEPVIRALKNANLPFLISTYDTDLEATQVRGAYYAKCGYEALECIRDERGICFHSPLGFCSFAYHPSYVADLFKDHELSVDLVPFAGIGIGYKAPAMR